MIFLVLCHVHKLWNVIFKLSIDGASCFLPVFSIGFRSLTHPHKGLHSQLLDLRQRGLGQCKQTLDIKVPLSIFNNLPNEMADHRLESRIVVRVGLHKTGQPSSLDDVGSSCLRHINRNSLQQLELSLLDLKRKVIVLNRRETRHHVACVQHDGVYCVFDHGLQGLESESLDLFGIFRGKHLAIVVEETFI